MKATMELIGSTIAREKQRLAIEWRNLLEDRDEDNSGTNVTCEEPLYQVPEDSFVSMADWTEALLSVGNIIIIIFSVCGNIGALLVTSRSKISKTSTKAYLLSLSVCDFILTLTSPTVDLSQLMTRYRAWIFGDFLCKVIPFVQTSAIMGVAFSLVVIAVERYLVVIRSFDRPSARYTYWKEYVPFISLVIAWILSIGSGIPSLWYYETISFWTYVEVNGTLIRPRNETCKTYYLCIRTDFDTNNAAYYSVLGFITLLLSACFAFCYISIIIFVRRHGKFRKSTTGVPGGPANTQVHRNQSTLRLILGLILLYLLCRVPLWVFVVITNVKTIETTPFTLILFYGFHLLSNINSLANPFIYTIFNKSIRSNDLKSEVPGKQSTSRYKTFLRSLCFGRYKTALLENGPPSFYKKNLNKYDLTKHPTVITSIAISTRKFQSSERPEFGSPIGSSSA